MGNLALVEAHNAEYARGRETNDLAVNKFADLTNDLAMNKFADLTNDLATNKFADLTNDLAMNKFAAKPTTLP